MIEQALYEHLREQEALTPYLAVYDGKLAVFSQEAPADTDDLWNDGPQYGRIVFAVDLQGDPERMMGGTLAVDIMCKEDSQYPEDIEPLVRNLIHGYFFSNNTFTVAAQWKNSSYFTQPPDHVTGCTLSFELLGFPVISTIDPDIVARINKWTDDRFNSVHVINYEPLPSTAWKPSTEESAIYWRLASEAPAGWIPDTYFTVWRSAALKGHIFAADNAAAFRLAQRITIKLLTEKRLMKDGEAPILVNRTPPSIDSSADPLRTGQLTVEGTYGVIVYSNDSELLQNVTIDKSL